MVIVSSRYLRRDSVKVDVCVVSREPSMLDSGRSDDRWKAIRTYASRWRSVRKCDLIMYSSLM